MLIYLFSKAAITFPIFCNLTLSHREFLFRELFFSHPAHIFSKYSAISFLDDRPFCLHGYLYLIFSMKL